MPFTPFHTALGGLLLHLSTSSTLADAGRVLGISGILDGAVLGGREHWRWGVVAGLLLGPVVTRLTGLSEFMPDPGVGMWAAQSIGRLGLAGFLVGLGSKLGSGCTSGHLLCGVSRWSPRSIIASATFFITAIVTANAFQAPVDSDRPAYTMTLPSTPAAILLLLVVGGIFLVNRARRRLLTSLSEPPQAVRIVPYFLAGLTFSLGLSLSGMISPLKVISFLRILPPWTAFDPSLAIIILTGVLPNALHYAHFTSNSDTSNGKPKTRLAWESWQIPHRTDIDWKLLLGAALFGVGWGLGGVCPGPAIVSLGQIVVNGFTGAHVSGALWGWVGFMGPLLAGLGVARAFV